MAEPLAACTTYSRRLPRHECVNCNIRSVALRGFLRKERQRGRIPACTTLTMLGSTASSDGWRELILPLWPPQHGQNACTGQGGGAWRGAGGFPSAEGVKLKYPPFQATNQTVFVCRQLFIDYRCFGTSSVGVKGNVQFSSTRDVK